MLSRSPEGRPVGPAEDMNRGRSLAFYCLNPHVSEFSRGALLAQLQQLGNPIGCLASLLDPISDRSRVAV